MKDSAFAKWFKKTHLIYLLIAIGLYIIKAVLYFCIASIPVTVHRFNMRIDDFIPFIKYFYVFYFAYYLTPEIFLWITSFYNKKKYWTLVSAVCAANIICCICFVLYQVQMVRAPGYPMDMAFSDIRSVSDFFDYAVSMQYKADATALNCFPSLHATMGCLEVLLGLKLSKNEPRLPMALRVLAVVFGVGCVLSTMFIKQHYFIDALAGVLLMITLYLAASGMINAQIKRGKLVSLAKDSTAPPIAETEPPASAGPQ